MSHVYFIGGAPRVGKSLLAIRILRRHPMFAVSGDTVGDMLRRIMKPLDAPALFAIQSLAKNESAMADFLHKNPGGGIGLQNDESAVIWPLINEIVLSYLAHGQDVLVEGVEILPSALAEVTYPYKVVFLGSTSLDHARTIAEQAHAQPDDWMHRYASDTVDAWAGHIRSFSAYVKSEAQKYNMAYIETHDNNFEQSLDKAERMLFGSQTPNNSLIS